MNNELNALQSRISRYYIIFYHDESRIRSSIQLLDFLVVYLPKWLGFTYQDLRNSQL